MILAMHFLRTANIERTNLETKKGVKLTPFLCDRLTLFAYNHFHGFFDTCITYRVEINPCLETS